MPRADVEVQYRSPVGAGRHDEQAADDQPAGIETAADERADDQQHQDRENAGRRQHQSREIRVIPEQRLQQRRQARAGAVENGIGAEHDDTGGREIALGEGPKVDDRIGDPQFAEEEKGEPEHETDQQRLHAPERVLQPVPLLPLAEHDFPRRHRQSEKAEPDVIEIQGLAQKLRSLRLQIRRIINEVPAHQQGESADRDIDVEDPAPFVKNGQVTAERRADRPAPTGPRHRT